MRSRVLASLALVASLAVSTVAVAQDSSGMVVASRGEVIALSNGGSRELKQGDFVYVADEEQQPLGMWSTIGGVSVPEEPGTSRP